MKGKIGPAKRNPLPIPRRYIGPPYFVASFAILVAVGVRHHRARRTRERRQRHHQGRQIASYKGKQPRGPHDTPKTTPPRTGFHETERIEATRKQRPLDATGPGGVSAGMPSAPNRHPDRLILASGSPRRRDLLAAWGLKFEVMPANTPEIPRAGELAETMVLRFSGEKARAVAERCPDEPRQWILGADTVVVLGERILGKPEDPTDAVAMLSDLVGQTHRVITGVTLIDSAACQEFSVRVESQVCMRKASIEEIEAYAATGEPLDKAGSYALQGEGRRFVESVRGSETNVIGLPAEETLALLQDAARWEQSA